MIIAPFFVPEYLNITYLSFKVKKKLAVQYIKLDTGRFNPALSV